MVLVCVPVPERYLIMCGMVWSLACAGMVRLQEWCDVLRACSTSTSAALPAIELKV